MTINQRFEKIINDLYNGNKRSFAITIGLAPTVIENIVGKRQGNPSFEVLQKTLYANANISAEWLILDIGDMYKVDVKPIDNEWILRRFEEIVADNAILKRENEELRQSRGNGLDVVVYPSNSSINIAAEPKHK